VAQASCSSPSSARRNGVSVQDGIFGSRRDLAQSEENGGLTLQIICKWRVVLNDGLHEQCCCRMVTRLRHLSPICPPCVRTRDRRLGTDFVVDGASHNSSERRIRDSGCRKARPLKAAGTGRRLGHGIVLSVACGRSGGLCACFVSRSRECARPDKEPGIRKRGSVEMGWTLGALPLN
jgi:hypothetical protein